MNGKLRWKTESLLLSNFFLEWNGYVRSNEKSVEDEDIKVFDSHNHNDRLCLENSNMEC